jgi:hypothetical protein
MPKMKKARFVKLNKDGLIPKGEMCPFITDCVLWKNKVPTESGLKRVPTENTCNHRGVSHTNPYSCGFARGFDIEQQ